MSKHTLSYEKKYECWGLEYTVINAKYEFIREEQKDPPVKTVEYKTILLNK